MLLMDKITIVIMKIMLYHAEIISKLDKTMTNNKKRNL